MCESSRKIFCDRNILFLFLDLLYSVDEKEATVVITASEYCLSVGTASNYLCNALFDLNDAFGCSYPHLISSPENQE